MKKQKNTITFASDEKNSKDPFFKEYFKLKGLTCVDVIRDTGSLSEPIYGLVLKRIGGSAVIAWIQTDEECNGPGHLCIQSSSRP